MRPLKFRKVSQEMIDSSNWCLLENGEIQPTHRKLTDSEKKIIDESGSTHPDGDYSAYGDGDLREYREDEHGNLTVFCSTWQTIPRFALRTFQAKVMALGKTREELERKVRNNGREQGIAISK